jgi:hypothetical protein
VSVEISKLIDGTIAHRIRFSIRPVGSGQWEVQITKHQDDLRGDNIQIKGVDSETEATALVYNELSTTLVDLLEDIAEYDDIGEHTWELAAQFPTPKEYLDLARLIMARVDDWLADVIEEREYDEMTEAGIPIRWGITDYETGEFQHTHTEYPGNPTKLVFTDGRIEYRDRHGEPVDEDGNSLETEA